MCFARNRKCAAELRAQERKKPSRIISLLLVISMLCGNFVGLPTVASEVVAYCGLEEHTHSDACYQAVQVAGETTPETLAADAAAETTAPTEAALVLSGGSDAQALTGAYVEKEQCCGKEEHTHTQECYIDPNAQIQTPADSEAAKPEEPTVNLPEDTAVVDENQVEMTGGDDAPVLMAKPSNGDYIYLDLSEFQGWTKDDAEFRMAVIPSSAAPAVIRLLSLPVPLCTVPDCP